MMPPARMECASLEELTQGRAVDAERITSVLDSLVECGDIWRMTSGGKTFYAFPPETKTNHEDAQ